MRTWGMTEAGMGVERRNVACLAAAQALGGAHSVIVYATGAVIGNVLAPDKSLATLPTSIFVVGMALATLPAGAIAHRHGRRAAFLVGGLCGLLAGLVAAVGVLLGSFALFCMAMVFGGAYAAIVLTFRFAAADAVRPERRSRALGLVMAGGIAAGILGPWVVTLTMGLLPQYLFVATFLTQAGLAVLTAVVLLAVHLPVPARSGAGGRQGRPLGVIARDPRFVAALICGTTAYLLMNFIMTSAPLAMAMCGLPMRASNLGLQWHVIAMYGPSFVTGSLVSRFGAARVAGTGLVLIAAAAIVGLSGVNVAAFWGTLVLLGIGWNFAFLGASSVVLETHRPEEKTRVQAFNDFIVFGAMVLASFASGGVLAHAGWSMVCWLALPLAVLAFLVLTATRLATRIA
jgi:MFS family permease